MRSDQKIGLDEGLEVIEVGAAGGHGSRWYLCAPATQAEGTRFRPGPDRPQEGSESGTLSFGGPLYGRILRSYSRLAQGLGAACPRFLNSQQCHNRTDESIVGSIVIGGC